MSIQMCIVMETGIMWDYSTKCRDMYLHHTDTFGCNYFSLPLILISSSCKATSHDLYQGLRSSLTSYGFTRRQWVSEKAPDSQRK